ncbi:MAG: hypothetical protein ACOY3I_01025 [Verrucomicrobiota bacterium]
MRMWSPQTGFTSLIQFGDQGVETFVPWVAETKPHLRKNCGGFDGQQYAQIATDPLLLTPEIERALDNPIYRARRIFLPWMAYVLGLGHTAWILQAYAVLNIVFYFLLLALLIRMIRPDHFFEWACILLVMFSTGVLESVRRALTDLPALYLSLLALYWVSKHRLSSLGLLTASVLTRETTILSSIAFINGVSPARTRSECESNRPLALKNIFRKQSLFILVPLAALLAWNAYLTTRFHGIFLSGGSQNLDLPLMGYIKNLIHLYQTPANGINLDRMFAIPAFIGLCIQCAYFAYWKFGNGVKCAHSQKLCMCNHDPLRNSHCVRSLWKFGVGFCLLFLILGTAVTISQRVVCRSVLPMTVVFHLLLCEEKDAKHRWWWMALGNLHTVYGLINFVTYRL